MCWASNGTIFMGKGSELYYLNPSHDKEWRKVQIAENEIFKSGNNFLNNITRLAINPTNTKIAMVVNQ